MGRLQTFKAKSRDRWSEPTRADRQRVMLMVAEDIPLPIIGHFLNISTERLQIQYEDELKHGKDIVRLGLLNMLMTAGKTGNVSAAKVLLERFTEKQQLTPKQKKLGKKETLIKEAHTAHKDSDWGEIMDDSETVN